MLFKSNRSFTFDIRDGKTHLQTLFLKLTPYRVSAVGSAGEFQSVGCAPSAAVILCGTIGAMLLFKHGKARESFPDVGTQYAVVNVSYIIFAVPDELMARIYIPRRRNRQIFRSRAAARQTLMYARTVVEIDHIMEEIEPFAARTSFEVFFGQTLVFSLYPLDVVCADRERIRFVQHDRLHRNLVEAEIVKRFYVFGKVEIVFSERAANVIFARAAYTPEIQSVFQNNGISVFTRNGVSDGVMHRFSAVDAQNYVVHFAVQPFGNIFVKKQTVRRHRETEAFARFRRLVFGVLGYALYDGLENLQKRARCKINRIAVAGGGSQSDIICRITADIMGREVYRVQTYETSGLGCAIVGFTSLGYYDSLENAVSNMVRVTDTFVPSEENHAKYMQYYTRVYKKIYERNLPIYNELYKMMEKDRL